MISPSPSQLPHSCAGWGGESGPVGGRVCLGRLAGPRTPWFLLSAGHKSHVFVNRSFPEPGVSVGRCFLVQAFTWRFMAPKRENDECTTSSFSTAIDVADVFRQLPCGPAGPCRLLWVLWLTTQTVAVGKALDISQLRGFRVGVPGFLLSSVPPQD